MKKLIIGTLILCYSSLLYAQPQEDRLDDLKQGAIDLIAKNHNLKYALKAGPSEDDVGDLDSFGDNKIYLGVHQTKPIVIQDDCSGIDPENAVCIEHALAPASTFVDQPELGSISLPEKATDSLLCFTFTQFSTYAWSNFTGSQQTGDMGLRFTVQVYNDALFGLSDINGVPFNGALFIDALGSPFSIPIVVSNRQTTLPDGAFEVQRDRITRSCTGGIVSKRSLRAQGLTEDQVKAFFKEPMKIVFGVRGNVSMTEFVTFFGGIRIYGDD